MSFIKRALLLYSLVHCLNLEAKEIRVKSVQHDLAKPTVIKIVPGLVSIIEMPCRIEEANVGLEMGVKPQISVTNSKRMSIVATAGASSTNMVVHCIDKSFVFDIRVQSQGHNDFIRIDSDFGDYTFDDSNLRDQEIAASVAKRTGVESHEVHNTNPKKTNEIKKLPTQRRRKSRSEVEYANMSKTLLFDSKGEKK